MGSRELMPGPLPEFPPQAPFCYNRLSAEVNLAWWLAWTSNPVAFTGRWARWVRFPCTSATFVLIEIQSPPRLHSRPVSFRAVAVTVDTGLRLGPSRLPNTDPGLVGIAAGAAESQLWPQSTVTVQGDFGDQSMCFRLGGGSFLKRDFNVVACDLGEFRKLQELFRSLIFLQQAHYLSRGSIEGVG